MENGLLNAKSKAPPETQPLSPDLAVDRRFRVVVEVQASSMTLPKIIDGHLLFKMGCLIRAVPLKKKV